MLKDIGSNRQFKEYSKSPEMTRRKRYRRQDGLESPRNVFSSKDSKFSKSKNTSYSQIYRLRQSQKIRLLSRSPVRISKEVNKENNYVQPKSSKKKSRKKCEFSSPKKIIQHLESLELNRNALQTLKLRDNNQQVDQKYEKNEKHDFVSFDSLGQTNTAETIGQPRRELKYDYLHVLSKEMAQNNFRRNHSKSNDLHKFKSEILFQQAKRSYQCSPELEQRKISQPMNNNMLLEPSKIQQKKKNIVKKNLKNSRNSNEKKNDPKSVYTSIIGSPNGGSDTIQTKRMKTSTWRKSVEGSICTTKRLRTKNKGRKYSKVELTQRAHYQGYQGDRFLRAIEKRRNLKGKNDLKNLRIQALSKLLIKVVEQKETGMIHLALRRVQLHSQKLKLVKDRGPLISIFLKKIQKIKKISFLKLVYSHRIQKQKKKTSNANYQILAKVLIDIEAKRKARVFKYTHLVSSNAKIKASLTTEVTNIPETISPKTEKIGVIDASPILRDSKRIVCRSLYLEHSQPVTPKSEETTRFFCDFLAGLEIRRKEEAIR